MGGVKICICFTKSINFAPLLSKFQHFNATYIILIIALGT